MRLGFGAGALGRRGGLLQALGLGADRLGLLFQPLDPLRGVDGIRDVTFSEDTATSRTGSGPTNLATIRVAITAAINDAGYLHIPEGRRDHPTPAEAIRLHGLD